MALVVESPFEEFPTAVIVFPLRVLIKELFPALVGPTVKKVLRTLGFER